ncbi:MAG TPA: hypothetical protein VK837_14855 [Longimicrobiales bacterium]|nr:hypothetical protein [Longimicrobiales bacterium]
MLRKITTLLAVPAVAFAFAACDVDQTQEGDMPDVDVEGGQLPEFEVDGPDVDVGEDTIIVPTLDVDVPEEGEGEDADG